MEAVVWQLVIHIVGILDLGEPVLLQILYDQKRELFIVREMIDCKFQIHIVHELNQVQHYICVVHEVMIIDDAILMLRKLHDEGAMFSQIQ